MGKVSHEEAEAHALKEFEKYQNQLNVDTTDELDKFIKKLKPSKKKDR